MKTFTHLWQYLAELFLQWEMFQIKAVEKINTHILFSIFFFSKIMPVKDNVEKCGGARHATDDNIIQHMRFACWITKATDTHLEYVILVAFPLQEWFQDSASVLRHTYIASVVCCVVLCCVVCLHVILWHVFFAGFITGNWAVKLAL